MASTNYRIKIKSSELYLGSPMMKRLPSGYAVPNYTENQHEAGLIPAKDLDDVLEEIPLKNEALSIEKV